MAYKFTKTDIFQRWILDRCNTKIGPLFENIKSFQVFQGQCSNSGNFLVFLTIFNEFRFIFFKEHLSAFACTIFSTCLTAIWLDSNNLCTVFSAINGHSKRCTALIRGQFFFLRPNSGQSLIKNFPKGGQVISGHSN